MKKKIAAIALSAAVMASMSVPAFAAGNGAAELTEGKSENTIPVTISAEATTFDVDVPTAFPTTLDPTTGDTTTADNATITNNSYGSIVVTSIVAKDNAQDNGGTATWHLTAFDKDMSQVAVDSNLIGLSVQPQSGRTGAAAGTVLKTDDSSDSEQTLLAAGSAEWVLQGKDATDGSNELTVVYDTNASAVSTSIVNETVANIVITIAWNTSF